MPRTRTSVAERTLGAARVRILDSLLHDDEPPPASSAARSAHSTLHVDVDFEFDAQSPVRARHERGANDEDEDEDDTDHGSVQNYDVDDDGGDDDDNDDDSDFDPVESDHSFESETDEDIEDHDGDDVGGDDDDDGGGGGGGDDRSDSDHGADVDVDAGDQQLPDQAHGGGDGDGGDDGDDSGHGCGGQAPSDGDHAAGAVGAPSMAVHNPVIPFNSGFKLPSEPLHGHAADFRSRAVAFFSSRLPASVLAIFHYLWLFIGMMLLKVFTDYSVSYACADAMFAVGQVRFYAHFLVDIAFLLYLLVQPETRHSLRSLFPCWLHSALSLFSTRRLPTA